MQDAAWQIEEETGKQVTFVAGRIQVRNARGGTAYVRGVVTEDGIVIQADNARVSVAQLAEHEIYHQKVYFFGQKLNDMLKEEIIEAFSREQFDKVLDKYIEGLRGIVDVNSVTEGEAFEELVRLAEEEIFADAYAGINAFGADTAQFTETVNAAMDREYIGKQNRQENGTRQTNGPNGERYSYDYSEPFEQQLNDWMAGKIPQNDSLLVSGTPEVWKMIGLNSLPVTINQKHIDYAINGTKDADHYLTKQGLLQLPEAIKSPVAIISSKTKNGTSLVAMLDIRQNGKQVIVPVVIDGFSRQNNLIIDSNAITSIYGKNFSISKVLYNALNDEASGKPFSVYYVDTKKATALLQKARVPMPKSSAIGANGFVHNIDEAGSPVKKKFSNQTESRQFKRWFEKSTVVNADGTPKVMYRGDSADFTVFDRKKTKPYNLYGRGFYFTDSPSHAGQYGNARSFYLSIQNPVSTTSRTITRAQLRKFLEAVAENEDYSFENYGYGATVDSVLESVYGKNDFAMLYDISSTAIGDAVEAAELFNKVNGTKYDGFILDTETVAFYPTQIKSATDNIGTFDGGDPDIRYSVDEAEAESDWEHTGPVAELPAKAEGFLKRYERDVVNRTARALSVPYYASRESLRPLYLTGR